MKKIFFIIIFIVAAAIFGYGIKYAVTPVSSQRLVHTTYEHSTSGQGYIVRDEIAYYADRSGRLYKNVDVGERVSKDSLIYTIYDGNVSDSVIKELNTLDKNIAAAREAQRRRSFASESISVESEIALRTAQIIEAGRNNDVGTIAKYKKDINSLRTNGYIVSTADELADYEYNKSLIDERIGSGKSESYAANAGVFTIYYDGLEDALHADRVQDYSVEFIESLGNPGFQESNSDMVNEGDFVCSIVNNHTWGVILILPEEELANHSAGEEVKLRFRNIADEEHKGTITYISSGEQNKDGKCFVLVECSKYFEGAYSYRNIDADLIFESYDGYRVPIQSVRTDNQTQKVIGIADNKQFECEIKVLYTDMKAGYVIVDSAENAAHKLSSMDRILVGER